VYHLAEKSRSDIDQTDLVSDGDGRVVVVLATRVKMGNKSLIFEKETIARKSFEDTSKLGKKAETVGDHVNQISRCSGYDTMDTLACLRQTL